MEIVQSLTPEEYELQQKLKELRELENELAQRELELITLQTELSRFQAHYLSIVGYLYAELDEVEARIAEAQARLSPEDGRVRYQANQARAKADESAKAAAGSKSEAETDSKLKISETIKKLYRQIAKCFHPDLANDEMERRHHQQLMAEANQAYRAGDEQRLQELLHRGRTSPETVKGQGISAELVKVIRQIARAKERLGAIAEEFLRLKESSLYEFKLKVADAETHGLDLIAEMAGYLRRQIVKSRVRLAGLNWKKPDRAGSTGLNFDDFEVLRGHQR